MSSASGQIPVGGPEANVTGVFGPVVRYSRNFSHSCLDRNAGGLQSERDLFDKRSPANYSRSATLG